MANHSKIEAKKDFPKYLEENFGIIGEACKKADVSYHWYYQHLEKDPLFKSQCEEGRRLGEMRGGDFVEKSLYNKILEGDTTCTIFYSKTKLKNRGYNESEKKSSNDIDSLLEKMDAKNFSDEELATVVRVFQKQKELDSANKN
jgi:hypothetical protein